MLSLLLFLIVSAAAIQYDYIIAGGGTGGLVVANRLSEDPDASVLVIEAGLSVLDNENVTNLDGYSAAFGTEIDWAYETTAQEVGGRAQIFRAGRALGGTSTINGMTYIRPNEDELNAWKPYGGENWTWRNMWPYFLKSESFAKPDEAQIAAGATFNTDYHGFNGRLQVSFRHSLKVAADYVPVMNKTLGRMGVPWNRDPNGGYVRGFTVHPATIDAREYVRHDAARAYYWPVSSRPNLHVLCNATVDRIVWAENDTGDEELIAIGAEVRDKSGSRVIHAKREVILAAGVFRSPAILELSGVGNPRILEKYGIATRIDLPTVGENLQEQINNSIAVATRGDIGGSRSLAYVSASDIFGDRVGDIANYLASKLLQYARQTAESNGNAISATHLLHLFEAQHELIFKKSIPIAEFRVNPGNKGINAGYWGLLPFSRGNVHIASADPTVRPVINPNYGLVDFDLEVQVALSKFLRRLFHSQPLSELVVGETHPGFDRVPEGSSDDVLREWIRDEYLTNYHPIGTLAMMPRSMGGVVDNRLKVYGTRNVRVADASIHSIQLCGHPMSSIYGIGEMVSDWIKEEWTR